MRNDEFIICTSTSIKHDTVNNDVALLKRLTVHTTVKSDRTLLKIHMKLLQQLMQSFNSAYPDDLNIPSSILLSEALRR